MDKYDEMIESERNYYEEDYLYEQAVRSGRPTTKEEEIAACWKMRKGRFYSNYP